MLGPIQSAPEPSVSRLRVLSGEPLVRRFESEQAFPALPHFPPPSSAFPRPPPPSSSDLVALLAPALIHLHPPVSALSRPLPPSSTPVHTSPPSSTLRPSQPSSAFLRFPPSSSALLHLTSTHTPCPRPLPSPAHRGVCVIRAEARPPQSSPHPRAPPSEDSVASRSLYRSTDRRAKHCLGAFAWSHPVCARAERVAAPRALGRAARASVRVRAGLPRPPSPPPALLRIPAPSPALILRPRRPPRSRPPVPQDAAAPR